MKNCLYSQTCVLLHLSESRKFRYSLNNRSLDFEDTVQYISAKSIKPDVIVTRNTRHFRDLDVMVKSPTEFLDDYFN